MEKTKNSLALFGIGISVGAIAVVVVVLLFKATPSSINIGPVEFEIPTTAPESGNTLQVAAGKDSESTAAAEPMQSVALSAGRAAGCFCEPSDCQGIRVIQGDDVPASSILEPHAGNRGTLYMYVTSGKAEVSGNLWVYVDAEGSPAATDCLESQLPSFQYGDLQVIK